jgi:hypothetical protein
LAEFEVTDARINGSPVGNDLRPMYDAALRYVRTALAARPEDLPPALLRVRADFVPGATDQVNGEALGRAIVAALEQVHLSGLDRDLAERRQLHAILERLRRGGGGPDDERVLRDLVARHREALNELTFPERMRAIERSGKRVVVLVNGLVKYWNDTLSYNTGSKIVDVMGKKTRALAERMRDRYQLVGSDFKSYVLATDEAPSTVQAELMTELAREYRDFVLGRAAEGESVDVARQLAIKFDTLPPQELERLVTGKIHERFTFGEARGEGAVAKANSAAVAARGSASGFLVFDPEAVYQGPLRQMKEKLERVAAACPDYFEPTDPANPILRPKIAVLDKARKYGHLPEQIANTQDPATVNNLTREFEESVPDARLRSHLLAIKQAVDLANSLDFPLLALDRDPELAARAAELEARLDDQRGTPEEIRARLLDALAETEVVLAQDSSDRHFLSKQGFLDEVARPENRVRFPKPIIGSVDIVGLGSVNIQEMMVTGQSQAFQGSRDTGAQGALARGVMNRGSNIRTNVAQEMQRFFRTEIGEGKYLFYMSGGDELFYMVDDRDVHKLSSLTARLREQLGGREGEVRNAYFSFTGGGRENIGSGNVTYDLDRANKILDKAIGKIKKREAGGDGTFTRTAVVESVAVGPDGKLQATVRLLYSDATRSEAVVVTLEETA